MSELPEVHVACVFNDAYAPHAATLALSLARSRGSERLRMTVLADDTLGAAVKGQFTAFLRRLGIAGEVLRIPAAMIEDLPPSGAYPPIIWYRLLLPELLPQQERVLYLDTDTLALQSLLPLYGAELGTALMGAIASPTTGWEWHCRRLGLDPAQGYLNSGVLLMDLAAMRAAGFTRQALETARRQAGLLISPDQDVLNMALQDRWRPLHPRWNALSWLWLEPGRGGHGYDEFELLAARLSPAIVHFEGSKAIKPWYYRSRHPLRDSYRLLRAQTPWPLAALEDRGPAEAVLRHLPLKWQHFISRSKSRLLDLARH